MYYASMVDRWHICPPLPPLAAAATSRAALSPPLRPLPAGFFQLLSALEILHAAVGLVGGSPLTSLMQWAGRSNVLFGVVAAVPETQNRPAVGAMFLAWALSEVIRYPWYAASVAGACPRWLTWLRCAGKRGEGRWPGDSDDTVAWRSQHVPPTEGNFA